MRKLVLALIGIVLVLSMSACKCGAAKQSVSEVKASHKLIADQLLKYVQADPKLSDKDKNDWKGLVDSDARNIDKLEKAMEN